MSSDFAACSALFKSLEAIAVISLQARFCIPGMTFLTAMPATPSTPHFTLPWFTDPPCDSSTLTFITHPCQGPFLWQLLSAWRLTGWPSPCVFVFCASFASRMILRYKEGDVLHFVFLRFNFQLSTVNLCRGSSVCLSPQEC